MRDRRKRIDKCDLSYLADDVLLLMNRYEGRMTKAEIEKL